MHKIEYDLDLNDEGRPCIQLSDNYEDKPEDKFFAIEISRYIIHDVLSRRSAEFDQETSEKLNECLNMLGQIGDEIAALLWENMKMLGDVDLMINKNYNIMVTSLENRDNLGKYVSSNGKIYEKVDGFKVLVTEEMKIYEFKDENWNEII
jgi:hypothetical protein